MSTFYKLVIKEIRRETPSSVSILFNVPEELKTFYQFVAGQYVTLKLTLDGQEVRRAYSICSSPKSGELRVAVKAVKNGFFSKFANENLKEGKKFHYSAGSTYSGNLTYENAPTIPQNGELVANLPNTWV